MLNFLSRVLPIIDSLCVNAKRKRNKEKQLKSLIKIVYSSVSDFCATNFASITILVTNYEFISVAVKDAAIKKETISCN